MDGHVRIVSPEAAAKVNAKTISFIVLQAIVAAGNTGRTTKELATELNLSRVTVSPRIAPLKRAGLIQALEIRRDGCQVFVRITSQTPAVSA